MGWLSGLLKPTDTRKFFAILWVIIIIGPLVMFTSTIGDEKTKLVETRDGNWIRVPDGYKTIADLVPVYFVFFVSSVWLYIFVGLEEINQKNGRQ